MPSANFMSSPIILTLDAELHILRVQTENKSLSADLTARWDQRSFLTLIPPEAQSAAADFFAQLQTTEIASTSQLFLELGGPRAVPIDLIWHKMSADGRTAWQAIIWNRDKHFRTERELMLLYAISSQINQSLGEISFSDDVLFQIHNMMDVDASALLSLGRGCLTVTASRGFSAESLILLKHLPAWQVDLYRPVDNNDPPASMPAGVMPLADRICRSSHCGPWLVIPIRTQVQLYGLLAVTRQGGESFTERERYLLMSLGRNLANANEKGRLFRRLKERNRNLARSRRELRTSLINLEYAHRELKQLDDMKKSFIALTSHELQTPLTTIIGNAELLQKSAHKLTPKTQASLYEMLEGVNDLRSRIDALLTASRVDSGLFAPRFDRCTTQQLFAELINDLESEASEHRLCLEPQSAETCAELVVDIELMKQALRMQLENALRHTPPGGQILLNSRQTSVEELAERVMVLWDFYPDIDLRLLRHRNYVLISVSDTGEGITADEKLKIFKPFYTTAVNHHHSERPGDGGKGFGLGLSLAKKIVESHDGLMWVEDRPGGGSCFLQLLPLPD